MIRLTDILLGTSLPLHRSLADYPRLSVRLTVDGNPGGETQPVDGDPETGIWNINSSLSVPEASQWLTVAVVAHVGLINIRLASTTFSENELLLQAKMRPNASHHFVVGNFSSLLFLMTCSVDIVGTSTTPTSNVIPDGDEQQAAQLCNFATALLSRFERLGSLGDLDNAISSLRRVVELTPDGHPNKPGLLNNLGTALRRRFERLGRFGDIDDAISSLRKAVELIPDGHPNQPAVLNSLGTALRGRFDRLGNISDLDNAISSQRKAVELTPEDHPNLPTRLDNLGAALRRRFACLGNREDIDNAMSCLQRALDLTPEDDPEYLGQLSNLGVALLNRFERLGIIKDIDTAIPGLRKAVELAPEGDPNLPGRLSNLGFALQCRFEHLGNLNDIENGISSLRKAVELTPESDPARPGRLSNLGTALRSRFERFGSLEDIENAISGLQKAVESSAESPDLPTLLCNLGGTLMKRFERLGSLKDIDDAISRLQKAIEISPMAHPDRLSQLGQLGGAFRMRFERLGNLDDIDNAISSLRKVAELTPMAGPDKPAALSNLGSAFRRRFESFGNLEDIDNAISNLRKAVELTPEAHPYLSTRLKNLGIALQIRFERLHDPEDLETGIQSLSNAAKSATGSAMVRLTAAQAWAKAVSANSRSPLPAFSCAIDLLPRIAWLGLPVTDQHALLADFGGIVREAVAAAIQWEELETAVEWAEQGRSVVWQNMLGLRTPLDDLRARHPHLANQIQDISRRMDASTSHDGANAAQKSSMLANDWENTVKEIRQLRGFEGFLKAKTFSQLAPVAHEGPVVILNVDHSRCDALVLIVDDSDDKQASIINIPLTRFSYVKGQKLSEKLSGILTSAGVRARGEIRKTTLVYPEGNGDAAFANLLRILWLDVVEPVITGLAYQEVQAEHLTRIWWCATGSLAFLPIHAAGIYGAQAGDKLSNYVVSSYTPTLTAILDLLEPVGQDNFKILTIAQPSTPYADPIPKTADEVKRVQAIAGDSHVVSLIGEEATVERVLRGMQDTNWIHLACHGQQCTGDPMKSGILLHDKILKLSDIVKHALPKAEFAFLSACQTATGDERIADESVHLAAGMFLAGYRSMIATMWSIKDDDAPRIAEDVYTRILKGGQPNRKEAAYALHDAVKRLRDSGADLMSWVPFIHIGR